MQHTIPEGQKDTSVLNDQGQRDHCLGEVNLEHLCSTICLGVDT
jgi:hypothetical protein